MEGQQGQTVNLVRCACSQNANSGKANGLTPRSTMAARTAAGAAAAAAAVLKLDLEEQQQQQRHAAVGGSSGSRGSSSSDCGAAAATRKAPQTGTPDLPVPSPDGGNRGAPQVREVLRPAGRGGGCGPAAARSRCHVGSLVMAALRGPA